MLNFMTPIWQFAQDSPALFVAAATLLGLVVGSFLNVVIYRLPRMMRQDPAVPHVTLATPRSTCPSCGHGIRMAENIPVLSYLWLRGKCAACANPISPRYPAVETITALLFAMAAWHFGGSFQTWAAWLFVAMLVVLALIDLDTHMLPDCLTLPLVWLGLLMNLQGGFTDLESAVLGAAGGYLVLWLVYWLFKLATDKEGLGYGDFKLLAALGAWFGWQALPMLLLLSSLTGLLVGGGLVLFARRDRHAPMPFGPYLALGGLAALFLGPGFARGYGLA